MSEVSQRLGLSIQFLLKNKIAKNKLDICRRLHISQPTLSMALSGYREPGLKLMLDYCDIFPINFRWLRFGEGVMIRENTIEGLLKKIADLELENKLLKEELSHRQ